MSDFPIQRWPPLNCITPFHSESLGDAHRGSGGTPMTSAGSGAFSDELVHFYPFVLYEPAIAVKMSYIVGATAAGNVDLGIYDSQENLLVSTGLTAQGTINTLQEIDITDTLLNPGVYFMAIKCTDGTGTGFRVSRSDEIALSSIPLYTEAGGAGAALPSTAVMALSSQSSPAIYAMAVHFSTLI